MDRQLLLLGLLRQENMHAYRLNEQLRTETGQPINLIKANVYDLFERMEQEGWVAFREEKVGNRPGAVSTLSRRTGKELSSAS